MKNNEQPHLLAHKQAVEAERRAQAILRRRHNTATALSRIAAASKATLVATLVVAATMTNANAAPTAPVTYCETWHDGGALMTFVETEHFDFTVKNMTMRNTPLRGRRLLVESPVVKGRPRVMDCRGAVVNGRLNVILTTMGGAEWRIVNPRVASS